MAEWRPVGRGGCAAFWASALAACFVICLSNSARAVTFTGRYDGIGTAAGLAMVLSADGDELHGRIAAAGQDVYLLNGQVDHNAAKGHLSSPGALADFKLEWQPSEVIFTLTPLLADGTPNPAAQKQYAFVRGKAKNPELANYHAEPPRRGESVAITRFLENYRGWSPKEVAIGYAGLSDLDRALINDYDHLQADLMNRLCRGGAPRASLMTVMDHQDVDCDALTALIDKAQATHQAASFNAMADDQRSGLYSVVACMHKLYTAEQCANIGAEPKRAAQNWQSAGRIFADISTYGARSGALVDELLDKDPSHAQRDTSPKPQPQPAPPSGASAPSSNAPATSLLTQPALPTPEKAPEPPPKVALAARPRAPVPHKRPSLLAGEHGIENQRVSESMLASVDQSAEITPREPDQGFKTGFGFDLRPSSGDTDPTAIVAGPTEPASRATASANSASNAAPVPRPRPRRPTSG